MSRSIIIAGLLAFLIGCGAPSQQNSTPPQSAVVVPGVDGSIRPFRSGPPASSLGLSQKSFAGERFVVFHTDEALLANDTNGVEDIYLKDLAKGTLERVSLTETNLQANGPSRYATISKCGRFVAFESEADNLVSGDGTDLDVFIRDRYLRRTIRVGAGNGTSWDAQISASGTALAFVSSSTDLVPGDNNGFADIFLYTLETGNLERISIADGGGEIEDSDSLEPSLVDDGKTIFWISRGSNLPGSNGFFQVYVRRLKNSRVHLMSQNQAGEPGLGDSHEPSESLTSQRMVFVSAAENLVAGDTNGLPDLFFYDHATRQLSLASQTSTGDPFNGAVLSGALSGDGSSVAMITEATNAATGDSDSQPDAIVKNLATGQISLVSRATGGAKSNGASGGLSLSRYGHLVVFGSLASNLHPNDDQPDADVFVHQLFNQGTHLCSPRLSPTSRDFEAVRGQTKDHNSVAVGDFDNDGNLDYVSVTGGTRIYFGDGAGRFPTVVAIPGTGISRECGVGDFNEDTFPDLALPNNDDGVYVVLMNAARNPTVLPPIPVTDEAAHIVVDDFDDDDHLDFAVSKNTSSREVSVRFGDGTGAFVAIPDLPTPLRTEFIRSGDFDENGFPDIIVGNPHRTEIFFSDGLRGFTYAVGPEFSADPFVVADCNRDNHLDLIGTQMFLGDGNGNFTQGPSPPAFGLPHVVDLDGDGNVDVVGGLLGKGLQVSKGLGNGTFSRSEEISLSVSDLPLSGDFNNDGEVDVLMATALLTGRGDGSFYKRSFELDALFAVLGVEVGDLNHDLRLDILALGNSGLSVFPGEEGGGFGARLGYAIKGFDLILLDLNCDGMLDIVTTGWATLNLGLGFYTAPLPLPPGAGHSLDYTDHDLDGFWDLLLARTIENDVVLLKSGGTENFSPATTLPGIFQGFAVASGILDGDEFEDCVVTDFSNLLIYRGQASDYALTHTFPVGNSRAHGLGVGDVNEDGNLDIVTANSPTNGRQGVFRIFLNNGSGVFTPGQVLPLERGVDDLRLVDLDQDGHLDVVTANNSHHSLSILYGDGAGTFTRALDIVTANPNMPLTVEIADLNGDLKPDILTANGGNGNRSASVYLQR